MSQIEFTPSYPHLTLVSAAAQEVTFRPPVEVLEAIRQARVILYDAPINPELLKYVPANCLMRYMGKRPDGGRYTQKEINLTTLQYLFSLGHVVRIKAIDPLAPGKGQEEIRYAQKFRIETEIIAAAGNTDGGNVVQPPVQHLPYLHLLDEGLKLAV
jgi:uroporphyrin-III C-methyltransferase